MNSLSSFFILYKWKSPGSGWSGSCNAQILSAPFCEEASTRLKPTRGRRLRWRTMPPVHSPQGIRACLVLVGVAGMATAILLVEIGVARTAGGGPLGRAELVATANMHEDVRFFARRAPGAARSLSKAHAQTLLLRSQLGCACTGISSSTSNSVAWGHYAPRCCSKRGEKTSVSTVLGSDIRQAETNTQALRAALASAQEKLNKNLQIVVDTVTLKGAGRQGAPGPSGKKGPQGYVGSPGSQGRRGQVGVVGPRGVRGHSGQVGYRGVTGEAGKQGQKGWEGSPGTKIRPSHA